MKKNMIFMQKLSKDPFHSFRVKVSFNLIKKNSLPRKRHIKLHMFVH